MKNKLILIFSLLVSITVVSQENKQRFSLKEAIIFALENNRTSKNAQRDIEAAKQQKWETTATGLPQIDASIGYQNFLKQPVSLLPAAAFDNTTSTVETVEQYFNLQPNSKPTAPEGFIPVVFGTKQNMNTTIM